MMAKTLGPNRCNRGSILPLVAVSAPLLLGGAGFAVDVAGWYRGNQRLQMAADAAALESSRLLTNASAAQSDFIAAATSAAKAVVSSSTGTLASPTVVVASDRTKVAVTLTSTAPRHFIQYFTSTPVTLSASATVGPAGSTGSGSGGGNCVLALSASANRALQAIQGSGILATNCNVFSNSNSNSSPNSGGLNSIWTDSYYKQGPAIYATGSGTVSAVGGIYSNPANTISPTPYPNSSSSASDPYASLTAPANGTCPSFVDYSGSHSGTLVMQPGTYCGGLTFGNGTQIVFNPGLYNIIDGNFTIGGGAQVLNSPGASFYLGGTKPATVGIVQWNNNATNPSALSAITSGWMQGILIYRDRSAAPSGSVLGGNATFNVSGVIYLPTDNLTVNNQATLGYPSSGGLQIIAQTIAVGLNGGGAFINAGGTLPSTGTARLALIQ